MVSADSNANLFVKLQFRFVSGEFYSGAAAQRLVTFMNKAGAEWSQQDLLSYHARMEPAIGGKFGRTTVWTSSAPTCGPQLISLLHMLSSLLQPAQQHQHDQLTLHYIHQLIESMRITQIQIARLGRYLIEAYMLNEFECNYKNFI